MRHRARIDRALNEVHAAIADIRAEYEQIAREQQDRHAVLVDAEHRTRVLATRAMAARRPRHLQPSETHGPRGVARDLSRSGMTSPIDARTQWSLVVMGLARPMVNADQDRD